MLGQVYENLKYYDKSETSYNKASNIVPSKLYYRYLLIKFLAKTNEKDKTIKHGNKFLNMKVKVSSLAIKQMKAEVTKILESLSTKELILL